MLNRVRVLAINARHPEPERVAQVAAILRNGEVVAVPTDTVYGLAADALNPAAVARVFAAKGRDEGKPLPVFVANAAQARRLAALWTKECEALAERFWPGALTLVVPARAGLPSALLAGGANVAVRQPDAPIVLALLAATDRPLTGTSANRSGEPPARDAATVAARLGDGLACIVDGGPSTGTLVSTVLDLTGPAPRVTRTGVVPRAALAACLPRLANE